MKTTQKDFVKFGREGVKASRKKYGKDAHKIFGKLGAKKRWQKKKELSTGGAIAS